MKKFLKFVFFNLNELKNRDMEEYIQMGNSKVILCFNNLTK